jgi:hypothetical protein
LAWNKPGLTGKLTLPALHSVRCPSFLWNVHLAFFYLNIAPTSPPDFPINFANYKRLALIVQNVHELEAYRPAAQEAAKYCERWGLTYEELMGTDAMVRRLIDIATSLDQVDENFLVVPTAGTLTQDQFFH